MKYLKRFENSTRLAADIYFKGYGDWMKSPNDRYTVNFCEIKYPDGELITFKVKREDYNSETLNIKIENQFNGLTGFEFLDFYLKVYGDNIQFESINEYRFVRKYLNKEDLIDHVFDAYLYSDEHKGPTECEVKLKFESNFSTLAPKGIIGFYNRYLRKDIADYVRINKNWKQEINNFFEDQSNIQRIYTNLEDKMDIESVFDIKPKEVLVLDNLTLSGALYLYSVLKGFKSKEKLKILFRDDHSYLKTSFYLDILEEYLD
jgi:hypothetical protein